MPKASPLLATFNAGELSPRLDARSDLQKYANGCRILENFIIYPHGGVTRRGGMRYVAYARYMTNVSRLVPFIYSTEQAYVLEFAHKCMRVFKDNGQVTTGDPAVPYEIASPYAGADLTLLQWVQSANVMWLVHPNYFPRKLTRTGHASWTLTQVTHNDGPFMDEDPLAGKSIIPSGTSGNITLTAVGGAIFDAAHAPSADNPGAIFRLRHSGTSVKMTASRPDQFTSSIKIKGKFTVDVSPDPRQGFSGRIVLRKSYDNTHWHDVASFYYSTKQEFFESQDDVWYRLFCTERTRGSALCILAQEEHWGVVEIASVATGSSATGTVLVPLGDTTQTRIWREGAWSVKNGFPSTVTYHEDRLIFGGTAAQPLNQWASWVGDYENFTPGDTDDAAWTVMLPGQVNSIQWMESQSGGLITGTIGGEITSIPSEGNPLIPKSMRIKIQSTHGSAKGVKPSRVGSALIFLQAARRKLRELAYDFQSDAFQAADLALLAEHVTKGGIMEFAYQQEPHSIIWAVRGDGVLLALTYYRKEDVVGWSRCPTDGAVESIAVIPSALGDVESEDQVWLVVRRTVGGEVRRFVERIINNEVWTAKKDFVHLDASLTYSGAPITGPFDMSHLAGRTVSIVADGVILADQVASGAMTIPTAAAKVHMGLKYTSKLQPMRIDAGAATGTAQGKKKKVIGATIRFLQTVDPKVGSSEDRLQQITKDTTGRTIIGDNFSGDLDVSPFPGNWETDGPIIIVQDQPMPMTVLGIMPKLQTND
jgi:hypothetical protein